MMTPIQGYDLSTRVKTMRRSEQVGSRAADSTDGVKLINNIQKVQRGAGGMKNMAEGIQERRAEHLWRSEERKKRKRGERGVMG